MMNKKTDKFSQALGTILFVLLGLIIFFSLSQISNKPLSEGLAPTNSPLTDPVTDLEDLISIHPAEVDNSKLPITPIEELHITGVAPNIYVSHYSLTVDGLVDNNLSLSYEQLLNYPTVTKVALLTCRNFFCDNAEWTGVPVKILLKEAGINPQARHIVFTSADEYQVTLSLEEIFSDDVFLAHTVNGEILPKDHGFPLRLVVTGEYGSQWIKWVERIEVK